LRLLYLVQIKIEPQDDSSAFYFTTKLFQDVYCFFIFCYIYLTLLSAIAILKKKIEAPKIARPGTVAHLAHAKGWVR